MAKSLKLDPAVAFLFLDKFLPILVLVEDPV
jgi:hypothetical protein